MTANTTQKLRREANSLLGLSVINIVSSAMVLAFGASALFPNLIAMAQAQTVLFPEVAWSALGLIAFMIGVRWLIATAEVLEIHEQLKEGSEKAQDEDAVTGVIVDAMASYREKKGTIKAMLLISRIAGICFLIAGIYSIATAALAGNLWLLTGAIPNIAIAVAAFIIPHYFSKYQQIWDNRVKESEKAEKLLAQQLGSA
jgi:Na+/melibiose symporter-like transporter